MSVISLSEIPMSRGGKATGAEMTEVRKFLVKCNSTDESIKTLAASGYLPAYLDEHPDNIFATCRELNIDSQPGKYDFIVSANYSTAPITQDERDKEIENPLARPAKIRWQSKSVATYAHRDINGKAIVNSAGDYFDPPPERPERRVIAHVTKNLSVVPAWILTYEMAMNDGSFSLDGITVADRCARASNITVSEDMEENDIAFRQVSFEIEVKPTPAALNCRDGNNPANSYTPKGWTIVLADQGLREKVTDTVPDPDEVTVTNMTDDNGDPVTSPALLDGNGARLTNPNPDRAIYLCWENLEALDFGALPLT